MLQAYGKLRFSPEFVRVDAGSEPVQRLAEWCDEAMGWAADGAGPAWRERYVVAPTLAFYCAGHALSDHGPGSSHLVGALAPSEDSFGRRFPFFVVARETGATPREPLTIVSRGQSVKIGQHLAQHRRKQFAAELQASLRRL